MIHTTAELQDYDKFHWIFKRFNYFYDYPFEIYLDEYPDCLFFRLINQRFILNTIASFLEGDHNFLDKVYTLQMFI